MKKNSLRFLFIFAIFMFCLIPAANAAGTSKYADVYFIGTSLKSKAGSADPYQQDQVILMKVAGKTILLDTGNYDKDKNTIKSIYAKAKDIGAIKNGKAVIDYMIISHLDDDHYGNAVSILEKSNFEVKNLIIKEESLKEGIYSDITDAARKKGTAIINTVDYAKYKWISISLDSEKKYNIVIFNTKDVYSGNSNCGTENNLKKGTIIKYKNKYESKGNIVLYNTSGSFTTNDKIFYYDDINKKYDVNTSSKLDHSKFVGYAYNKEVPVCRSNANSLGIVISVKTEKSGGKNYYMYFANDLDNNGFDLTGKKVDGTMVYGTGASYMINSKTYSKGKYLHKKSDLKESIAKKNDNAKANNVEVPSEYRVAKNIVTYLEKNGDSVNDIVIYQQSHHGQNNSPEAIKILNLNRSNVYAVATTQHVTHDYQDPECSKHGEDACVDYYDRQRTKRVLYNPKSYFLMKHTTSVSEKFGVNCYILNNGKYECNNY